MIAARCAMIAAIVSLTSCGGGGGASNGVPAAQPSPAPAQTASVTVSVHVPRDGTASLRRAPAYVSPGTARMSVTVGGVVTTVGCAAPATTCSAVVAAPLGVQIFSVSLFDTGSQLLSTGFVNATVVANTLNTVNLTFNGVIASIGLSLSSASLAVGIAATSVLSIVAKDADGFVIAQPGNYVTPIVVTTTPALPASLTLTGATTIAAIPAATSTITVNYTGGVAPAMVTFAATSGTVTATPVVLAFPPAGSLSIAPTALQFTSVPGAPQTVTITESNYAGTFTAVATGCSGIATVSAVVGHQFTVTPVGVGGCSGVVTDTIGGSATFGVQVETTTIVGS